MQEQNQGGDLQKNKKPEEELKKISQRTVVQQIWSDYFKRTNGFCGKATRFYQYFPHYPPRWVEWFFEDDEKDEKTNKIRQGICGEGRSCSSFWVCQKCREVYYERDAESMKKRLEKEQQSQKALDEEKNQVQAQ